MKLEYFEFRTKNRTVPPKLSIEFIVDLHQKSKNWNRVSYSHVNNEYIRLKGYVKPYYDVIYVSHHNESILLVMTYLKCRNKSSIEPRDNNHTYICWESNHR